MNIALFSDSYSPTKSGVVTVVVQLRKVLEQFGHKVVIVTVEAKDYNTEGERDILRVTSIPSPVGDGQYLGLPHRKMVEDFLLEHKIDIIHAHTEFFIGHMAIVAGRELNIPVIATTHTMWEDYYRYYLALGKLIPRRVIRKGVQLVYKKFYAFINVSQKAHVYFNKPFMLPKIPSAIIPNAIDSDRFSACRGTEEEKSALRQSLGITEADRVILYVGRVVEEKRVFELLDIMNRVVRGRQNVKMLFVGAGTGYDEMLRRTEEMGLDGKVIYAGFVSWEKLYLYYDISHIFITVSLSEMHSMTVLEALAQSLPVVCRKDLSFIDTIYQGENGYMAETDKEMDAYLYDLIDNPEKAAKMGKRSYEISRRFSLRIHGMKTVAFYKEVLAHYPEPVTSDELMAAVQAAEPEGEACEDDR